VSIMAADRGWTINYDDGGNENAEISSAASGRGARGGGSGASGGDTGQQTVTQAGAAKTVTCASVPEW
jgi:hypothetical protein